MSVTDARNARRTGLTWLAVAGAILVGAVVYTAVSVRDYFTVAEVRLPEVVGMRHDEAAQVLRRMGLEPVTFVEHVAGAAPEAVTSQAPPAGATVKHGRTIHLGVNTAAAAERVPDLTGMREADAKQLISDLNLPLATTVYEPNDRAMGTVIGQAPEGGAQLASGEELTITVSSGRQLAKVAVPELSGMPLEEAVRRLEELGFGRVETVPSAVSFTQAGDVVSVWPAAGTEVVLSTPVVVNYALSSRNVVQVPDVLGMPQWRAQLALRAAQLQMGPITFVDDPAKPAGVVDIQPTGYTLPGTPVLLTINGEPSAPLVFPDLGLPGPRNGSNDLTPERPRGDAAAGGAGPSIVAGDGSRTIPFTFDPTFMGVRRLLEEPYRLQLIVSDERGERTVFDETMDPGEVASTSVPVYGSDALLQTYIDGVFFQAWRP